MVGSGGDGQPLDRRKFLALGAGGLSALSLGGASLSVPKAFAASDPASAVPNYYRANIAPPDVDLPGAPPGYTRFPKTLVKTVAQKPAKGGKFVGMTLWSGHPLPTPMGSNSGWQQLNQELGAELEVDLVQQSDYGAKWGTVTAGGDLPDMMYISVVPVLPNVAAFVRSACMDLSSYLGGDAVKAYPNLANFPTASWKAGMIDGQLWGIPIVRPNGGFPIFVETKILEKLGMAGHYPNNADEFKAFCKALTNPGQGRWAFGVTNDNTSGPYSMVFFQGMFRAPNNWRLQSNGSLLKDIESEEYKAALGYLRDLVAAGYVSPDVKSNSDLMADLISGKIVMRSNSINGYIYEYIERAGKFGKLFRVLPPLGHDGKPGTHLLSPGYFGWTAIKKSDPDRTRQILGILDYLGAPFGSEEFMVTKFGKRVTDWDFDKSGVPQLTDQGFSDMSGTPGDAWDRLSAPPPFLFSSTIPDAARFAAEDSAMLSKVGVEDPTWGQYSATDARMGAQLSQMIFDRVCDIAAGRKPLADLDQLVKDWRSRGGDKIRGEYEQAIHG